MKVAVFLLISLMSSGVFSQKLTDMQLSQQLNTLEKRADELEKVYAFSVRMNLEAVPAKAKEVIPFPVNNTNIGLGYRFESNSFVAPKTGVYAFFVKVDCSPEYRALDLTLNGQKSIGKAHNDVDDRHLGTFTIVVLKVGDIVDVRHAMDHGKVDGGPESIFVGWWIGPDHSVYKSDERFE